ncbi:MAG: pyridoxal-phosphate dependent enzyme [Candidatus Aminicenantes bacterium]|nr:pyridoxal-phosphate dependent enzyme [Candidatus Aminicenantes bacterium]
MIETIADVEGDPRERVLLVLLPPAFGTAQEFVDHGFLTAVRPAARVVGVEPETSAFMAASLDAGRLVEIDERETIADAVAGGIEPGSITFPICRDLVDAIEVVPEALIARGLALVEALHGRIVEGAGALPFAAMLHSPAKWAGRTVVAVVSGGNIAPERFRAVVAAPR